MSDAPNNLSLFPSPFHSRAHTLSLQIKSATYDASTYSVIFDFTKPMETPRAYRVEVSQERVYGARGEEHILKSQLYSAYIL